MQYLSSFNLFQQSKPILPPSLPRNWPRSTEADIAQRPKRVVNISTPQEYLFRNNFVKTSKYELWNFLPKFLLEEFNPRTKVANCYFLMISALQCIPQITNTNGYPTTLIPLLFVVIIDGIFQSIEDLARHRADKEANASITYRYDTTLRSFQPLKWFELQVGDFVKVNSREIIPADMIILSVAEKGETPQGLCYVETKSLDGETNLKVRNTLPKALGKITDKTEFENLHGSVEMEHPNKLIDSFTGIIDIVPYGRDPIQPTNLLLRGCVLRNTDWVIGFVVNTGHDTKIMMSNTETKPKTSYLESQVSKQIVRIIILLATICFWGAMGTTFWNSVNHEKDIWYLGYPDINPGELWFIKFFYYFLLHASFIPVSLYVSMAVVRFYQGYFMKNDLEMYYPKTDTPALVRTMTLNEELGQISHIFSDKTGTLTCNIMDFRKMSISGESYGLGITEIGKASWKLQGKEIPVEVLEAEELSRVHSQPHVSFYDPKYKQSQKDVLIKVKLDNFFRFLAICHDVLPERIDGKIKLSASNPDDEALVCASEYFGFQFIDRRDKNAIILNKDLNVFEEVEILNIIEFSSKRKRMSVIARDIGSYPVHISTDKLDIDYSYPSNGSNNGNSHNGIHNDNQAMNMNASRRKLNGVTNGIIRIYTKGADTVMLERFRKGQDDIISKTTQHVKDFSVEGLRCLLLGSTEISEEKYRLWSSKYEHARSDILQIEKKKKGLENDIESLEDEIEHDLLVIGATAIEDRLQDGVPECIEELAAAGINIWVLTGDKEETAINIAVACNLVKPKQYMEHIIINKTTAPNVESMKKLLRYEIERYEEEIISQGLLGTKPRALVIDGPCLITAMTDNLTALSLHSDSTYRNQGVRKGELDWMMNPDIKSLPSKQLLILLSKVCQAVIGCRVSPDQKREMVHLVKSNIPGVRTLAIGDGANDVAMIQEAHVGVGIRGEEGVQAVNSSDIAIAQFRFLSSILLKHGRYNYIRMCSVVCYMFYKNILMSIGQFWINFYNAWSGQKYYTEGAIQMFNLLYTSIPILLLGIYDMDINAGSVFRYPKIYQYCVQNYYFSTPVFWGWIADALFESVWMSILPLYTLTNSDPKTGTFNTFWEAGATCYTVVIIIVNVKIYFMQSRVHWVHILVSLFSFALWIASAFFINRFLFLDYDWYYIFDNLVKNGSFYLTIVLLTAAVIAKDTYIYGVNRDMNFKPHQIIQEMDRELGKSRNGTSRIADIDRDSLFSEEVINVRLTDDKAISRGIELENMSSGANRLSP